MMDRLVTLGLWLSAISFALFVVSLLVQLFRKKTPAAAGGLGNAQQQGAAADLGKLFEALSKLADSLNHSSPVVLSLMASIIFFALAPLGAGLGQVKQKDNDGDGGKEKKAKVSMSTQTCIFSPFDTGKHELSKAVTAELGQDSDDCGTKLLSRVTNGTTSVMFLVGHTDHRNLRGSRWLNYGTNETLAYQRALALKKALLAKYSPTAQQSLSPTEFARRMIIVEGGPSYLDRDTTDIQLAEDRSVEVISIGLSSELAGSASSPP